MRAQVLLGIPGVGALVDGLAAYTQRHAQRLDRLRRSAALLDYTLGAMRVVAPAPALPQPEAPAQPSLPQARRGLPILTLRSTVAAN